MPLKIVIQSDDIFEIKTLVKQLNQNFDSEELLYQKKKKIEEVFYIAEETSKHCENLEQFELALQKIIGICSSEIE